MIRRAFLMRLKPDAVGEYRRHHENIWPELVAEIERSGICSITTFERGAELLVVSEIADFAAWERLWNTDVHRRWSKLMASLVKVRDDGAIESLELAELFHIAANGVQPTGGGSTTTAAAAPGEAARDFTVDVPRPGSPSAWTPPHHVRKSAITKPAGKKKAPGRKTLARKTVLRGTTAASRKAGKKPRKKKTARTTAATKVAAKKSGRGAQARPAKNSKKKRGATKRR